MAHIIPQLCVVLVDLVPQKLQQEHDRDLVIKRCDESWSEKKADPRSERMALSTFTLTLRAEVNRVYSDSQSQFLLKVFTACVLKSTPNINQETFFNCLQKERIDDI